MRDKSYYQKRAKEIIDDVRYFSIATVSGGFPGTHQSGLPEIKITICILVLPKILNILKTFERTEKDLL